MDLRDGLSFVVLLSVWLHVSSFTPQGGWRSNLSSPTKTPRRAFLLQQRHEKFSATSLRATKEETCQVLVLGSGPAGRSVAALLAAKGVDTILADKNADREFPPNYGVWQDEWETICRVYKENGVPMSGGRMGEAVDYQWDVTDCYFGGSFDIPTAERMRLDRPYCRIDRQALRESLSKGYRVIRANHRASPAVLPNIDPSGSITHDASGSTVVLDDDTTVRAQLVIDGTGHETKLLVKDAREVSQGPGYQIAYGCLVDVEVEQGDVATSIGPYDSKAMALFDYRTDHYDASDEMTQQKVAKAPTFMYAMPLGGNQIFFEETSLVARPAISFQECKDRCMKRLEYHGIKVTKLHEEEFCYIPMGGALPAKDQRIIGIGGAAAMVHPSTGYHLHRCLIGASDVATVIAKELAGAIPDVDRIAGKAYHALWSPANQMQRNFAVFGGEYLMKQNVVGLRGFFDGFFRLPLPLWAGFLAGWPNLPNNDKHETWASRLWYGVSFLIRLHPKVSLDMVANIVYYMVFENWALAQSVTPLLGEPGSFDTKPNQDRIGDVAAKMEARHMIQQGSVPMDLPVDFEGESKVTKPLASVPAKSQTESAQELRAFE